MPIFSHGSMQTALYIVSALPRIKISKSKSNQNQVRAVKNILYRRIPLFPMASKITAIGSKRPKALKKKTFCVSS